MADRRCPECRRALLATETACPNCGTPTPLTSGEGAASAAPSAAAPSASGAPANRLTYRTQGYIALGVAALIVAVWWEWWSAPGDPLGPIALITAGVVAVVGIGMVVLGG